MRPKDYLFSMLLTSQRPSMFKLLYHADGCESCEGGALLRVFVQKMLFNLLLQSRLQVHSLRRAQLSSLIEQWPNEPLFDLHTRGNGNTDKSRKDHHDTSMTPKKWDNYKRTVSTPLPRTTLLGPVLYMPRRGLKLSPAFGYIFLRIIFRRFRESFVTLSTIRIYVVCFL